MKEQIASLHLGYRLGTAQNYEYAMRCFSRFLGEYIPIESITEQLVERFNAYLVQRRVVRNTLSFYMRILRSVYNKAIRKGLAGKTYPFKNVYTGIDRLCKLAVDEQIIARASG